ncbi:hypothetical protein RUM43_002685 [Polyplax serrata]|uniref:F5/8 type C domain-containing protein n=1 Tax=Polyplax serrata TaxID=468196 RepID=A0AAN8RW27_POLSC
MHLTPLSSLTATSCCRQKSPDLRCFITAAHLVPTPEIPAGLRVEKAGGAWCPKQQVEKGVREYLQIDLNGLHMFTGIQTQGRYDHGRGQEYMEEYTMEYWRPSFDKWKGYHRWDGKQVQNF